MTPFPEAYPTNPPLAHTKNGPLASITNIMELCPAPTFAVPEDEDEEIDKDGLPWTHTPVLAGQFIPPPTLDEARLALVDLRLTIQPPRSKGGYKDPKLDLLLCSCLEKMRMFLWNYTDSANNYPGWMAASLKTAHAYEKGPWLAGCLHKWVRAYCKDRRDLPMNIYGTWNSSKLEDEDFAQELLLHLQGIGKYVRAMDIVEYLDQAEVKSRLKLTKTISLATAQHWMKHVGYRWLKTPTGQFVDGHERVDVVDYQQGVFLPIWAELLSRTQVYATDSNECPIQSESEGTRKVVIWNHDESTYYANDHRKIRWVHNSETAIPHTKGEGASLMVANIISSDYGWLRSPNGTESAQVLFKAGKARKGYFTCEDIIKQASKAMDILE
jgi:hypothetical protein